MHNISNSQDFVEVPRTKHVNKRLIKSRVLAKLLFSLSMGDIAKEELAFSEKSFAFIQTLSSIQLTELSSMLVADFSVDISIAESNSGSVEGCASLNCSLLMKKIAKHYINEWVLGCSNDYRVVYDEYSRGVSDDFLDHLIRLTPYELVCYEEKLVTSGLISIDLDSEAIERTISNARHLFRQDKLIIQAISFGASLPQLKQFFMNHRLCDSRSVAVIKRLVGQKESNKNINKETLNTIAEDFQTIKATDCQSQLNNNEFLSNLFNLLTYFLYRFDVSFSDSWNAIRTSTANINTRSVK